MNSPDTKKSPDLPPGKWRSIAFLLIAEVAAMSLWFVTAAVLPEMAREEAISATRQALLSSGVQGGFVLGALGFAISGLPDRFDPRWIFALSTCGAAVATALLVVVMPGGDVAIGARVVTGIMLAGVYPVGMKIAVGWGVKDRGLLVSLIVGALTLGSASPHLVGWAVMGGGDGVGADAQDWRTPVLWTAAGAALGGVLVLAAKLGPYHAQAPRFDTRAIGRAWTDRRIRLAIGAYLGHMWELYVLWAWVGVAAGVSYASQLAPAAAIEFAKLTAFISIALGGFVSVVAGYYADRVGKAEIAILAMSVSGLSAIATALSFGGPVWVTFLCFALWGAAVVPDSAQFSALVADFAPPAQAGSIMTLQTALGFALTFVLVQAAPMIADQYGWPLVLAGLAIGPALGLVAMFRLMRLQKQ